MGGAWYVFMTSKEAGTLDFQKSISVRRIWRNEYENFADYLKLL